MRYFRAPIFSSRNLFTPLPKTSLETLPMTLTSMTDPVDACTISLLRDLAELDLSHAQARGRRSLLIKSALEEIDYLQRAGGGSLGMQTIEKLREAVFLEVERFARS